MVSNDSIQFVPTETLICPVLLIYKFNIWAVSKYAVNESNDISRAEEYMKNSSKKS